MTSAGPFVDGERPIELRPRSSPGPAPLSFVQQRFWFAEQWAHGTAMHNLPVLIRLPGTLDTAALRRALQRVMLRHEILRTRFVETAAGPVQHVEANPVVSLTSIDLSAEPAPQRSAEVWLRPLIQRRFDLSTLPLLRAHLVTLTPSEHLLVVVAHHLVLDAWSAAILRREIGVCYRAERDSTEVTLPPLPVQYADFALWQRAWAGSAAYGAQLAYWTRRMAGAPMLTLPTDRPRSPRPTFAGEVVPVVVDGALVSGLRAIASRHRATLAAILMAALHALLARYAGEDDVTIGLPVANRTRTELENVIGPFLNTLVIRAQAKPERPFTELLEQVREALFDALAHQDLPFDHLAEAVQPRRDRTRSPLFDVLFSLEAGTEGPAAGRRPGGLSLPMNIAQFDVTVRLHVRGEQIVGGFEYRADLFDRWRIEQISQQYLATLHAVAAAPERHLATIWGITEASSRSRATTWPSAGRPELIVPALARQATLTPDAPAVRYVNCQLTYRALRDRVELLTQALKRRGAGRGTLVAVALPRSENLVAALLAVLNSGAAFVPLDPDQPRARLEAIIDDARPVCVLTTDDLTSRLPDAVPRLLVAADGGVDEGGESQDDITQSPGSDICDGDAAYLLYTSGSTGQPKGVIVEHRALAAFVTAVQAVLPFKPGDRHLALTTPTFDIALLELILPLTAGAEVIVATEAEGLDAAKLSERAIISGATSIQTTPSRWDLLLNGACPIPRSVRFLVGGEPLSGRQAIALREGDRDVWNLYGPTEATIWATAYRVTGGEAADVPSISLGPALPGYEVYVLDDRLSPVPPGIIGEVYLGGRGLARGYSGQPALTAQRFVANPLGESGARMYRTGDRGWMHSDGRLEYAGRSDRQIKFKGVRLELGEVDGVLRVHPAVRDVQTLVNGEGEQRVVAYVRLDLSAMHNSGAIDHMCEELERLLASRLPPPAGHVRVVAVDRWPLTPAGKLDRMALPKPVPRAPVAFRPPQAPHERILCELFESVLERPQIGLDDDFFHCGGHSLAALRLMARIREIFEVPLPVGELFDHPTVGALAPLIERKLVAEIAAMGSGSAPDSPYEHDAVNREPGHDS